MPRRPLLLHTASISFAIAVASVQALPTYAYTPFEEGMRQFQARRYSMAFGPLERAVSKAPQNAMARYYLANCYVHLNRHEDAQREYDMSYRLDPFGPVSGYCRRALIGYGMAVPTDSELAAGRSAGKLAVARPGGDAHQHNAPQHLTKAVDTIRRQADFEKGRHKGDADTFASNALKTGEGTARKILDDADAEIRAIMEAPLVVAGGGRINSYLAQQARDLELQRRNQLAAEIRKKAEGDAARVRSEAQERSQQYRQHSQNRQAALDEVADSLESQLSTSRLKDRVKMRAEGTGLYVRNFGVSNSPAPEVHSSVARIRPHETSHPPDEHPVEPKEPVAEKGGEAGKLPVENMEKAPEKPERSVRGKVLNTDKLDAR